MPRRSTNRARHLPEETTTQEQPRPGRDQPDASQVELEWGADEDQEPYDEDDYGPGVYFYTNDDDQPEEPPQSDLADAAYLDPLALVNAWEGALTDLKELHQERFLPPSEAPLTPTQKQAKAPFWYGPPASEASTSQLPPPPSTSTSALPSSFSAASLHARADSSAAASESTDAPPTKKRKRLTGSQKKARKAAKLALGAGAHAQDVAEDDEDDGPSYEPPSPVRHSADQDQDQEYTPQSPELARTPALAPASAAGPSHPASSRAAALAFPPAPPVGARPPSGGGAELAFVIPPVASLPRSFPPPPTITPLTGREAPLDPETPEQLLEAALWSWFTAGYQTALLHAAAGVARFAPSAAGEGAGAQE